MASCSPAAGETYTCRAGGSGAGHSDGVRVGTLSLSGDRYEFTSVDGREYSGSGALSANGDGFTVVDGPLLDVLGIVTLTLSEGSEGTNVGLYTEFSETYSAAGCLLAD